MNLLFLRKKLNKNIITQLQNYSYVTLKIDSSTLHVSHRRICTLSKLRTVNKYGTNAFARRSIRCIKTLVEKDRTFTQARCKKKKKKKKTGDVLSSDLSYSCHARTRLYFNPRKITPRQRCWNVPRAKCSVRLLSSSLFKREREREREREKVAADRVRFLRREIRPHLHLMKYGSPRRSWEFTSLVCTALSPFYRGCSATISFPVELEPWTRYISFPGVFIVAQPPPPLSKLINFELNRAAYSDFHGENIVVERHGFASFILFAAICFQRCTRVDLKTDKLIRISSTRSMLFRCLINFWFYWNLLDEEKNINIRQVSYLFKLLIQE